jgi:hypothetical protein
MPELLSRLRLFFLNSVVQSSVLTLISLWFFLAIGFPSIFTKLPIFQQKWFGITTLVFYSIVCILFIFPKEIPRLQKWYTAINSIILMTFSALYFIRVNNSPFELLSLNLSTRLIFIPLAFFIFLVNYHLLAGQRKSLLSLVGQVILYSLTTFSLVYYFDIDATAQRAFRVDFLESIFRLPLYLWLILASSVIAFVTTFSFKIKEHIDSISTFLFLFTAVLQASVIINYLTIGYWAKTLLLLIIWDYLYQPASNFLSHPNEKLFTKRLYLSTIYHIGLIAIVLFVNLQRV